MALKSERTEVRKVKGVDKKTTTTKETRCRGRQPAFVFRYKRPDKEPWTPDHQGLGPERERACRNKERDGRGHEVHLSICVCLCEWCFIWGRGESQETGPHCAARSNEGGNEGLGFQSCPLQVHHGWPRESQGTEGAEEGWWVSMKIGELDLDSSNSHHSQTTTQGVKVTLWILIIQDNKCL